MITVEFITALFYEVDEQLPAIPKHPEARLWPSEEGTLGWTRWRSGGATSSRRTNFPMPRPRAASMTVAIT